MLEYKWTRGREPVFRSGGWSSLEPSPQKGPIHSCAGQIHSTHSDFFFFPSRLKLETDPNASVTRP